MAVTLQVVDKSGTVKKIPARCFNRTMGGDGAWFSSDATIINVNDYLKIADEDFVIIQAGHYVDIKFSPDSSESDGQGTSIPTGLAEIKVMDVKDICKGLRAADATFATTKADAYASGSAFSLAVNDVLLPADIAICNKSGYFTLRFTAFDTSGPYVAIPIVRLYADMR